MNPPAHTRNDSGGCYVLNPLIGPPLEGFLLANQLAEDQRENYNCGLFVVMTIHCGWFLWLFDDLAPAKESKPTSKGLLEVLGEVLFLCGGGTEVFHHTPDIQAPRWTLNPSSLATDA